MIKQPWVPRGYLRRPWESLGKPQVPLGTNGFPWILIGNREISMEPHGKHGNRWIPMRTNVKSRNTRAVSWNPKKIYEGQVEPIETAMEYTRSTHGVPMKYSWGPYGYATAPRVVAQQTVICRCYKKKNLQTFQRAQEFFNYVINKKGQFKNVYACEDVFSS